MVCMCVYVYVVCTAANACVCVHACGGAVLKLGVSPDCFSSYLLRKGLSLLAAVASLAS